MATMQIQNRRANLLPYVAIFGILLLCLLALSPPSRHAVQNHAANAYSVTQRFKQIDPDDDDVWQSIYPDGRRYTFRALRGGAFDVSIDDPFTGENITRFTTTSKNWVARKLAWCE